MVNPSFLVGPTHGIFAAKPLLQHEAELSNEAGEGKGAKGVDAVHVLQDALLLFLAVMGVDTWWFIPVSKWDITPVINGISRVNPLIIGVITHLLSGMNHQVGVAKLQLTSAARGNCVHLSKCYIEHPALALFIVVSVLHHLNRLDMLECIKFS